MIKYLAIKDIQWWIIRWIEDFLHFLKNCKSCQFYSKSIADRYDLIGKPTRIAGIKEKHEKQNVECISLNDMCLLIQTQLSKYACNDCCYLISNCSFWYEWRAFQNFLRFFENTNYMKFMSRQSRMIFNMSGRDDNIFLRNMKIIANILDTHQLYDQFDQTSKYNVLTNAFQCASIKTVDKKTYYEILKESNFQSNHGTFVYQHSEYKNYYITSYDVSECIIGFSPYINKIKMQDTEWNEMNTIYGCCNFKRTICASESGYIDGSNIDKIDKCDILITNSFGLFIRRLNENVQLGWSSIQNVLNNISIEHNNLSFTGLKMALHLMVPEIFPDDAHDVNGVTTGGGIKFPPVIIILILFVLFLIGAIAMQNSTTPCVYTDPFILI